ncbi:MAG: alpha-amylase family protein [Erysipelotrichaceae bacterium]
MDFQERLNAKQVKLKQLYHKVYGQGDAVEKQFRSLIELMSKANQSRKSELVLLDQQNHQWYSQQTMIGMTLYVDLFCQDLKKLKSKVSYFKELGIGYVHLMPLLKPRENENDGGYAVEDYRAVDPRLGTMDDLIAAVDAFRKADIAVCIDYVINHVAKEHEWAKKALQNDPEYQNMFFMYDTDEIPNLYNQTVPEVLPDKCPGNFTYYDEINKYVFTSFSHFQWDLNFSNPDVFNGMSDNMLYLANMGINMLRLDAIPFMWKEVGTSCRNLKPIHTLLKMLNLIKEIVCPSLVLLGEAIVEPEQIVTYFGDDVSTECEVMYNANLMVDVFNSFATRDVRLMMMDANRFRIPRKSTWMNYVRCHDDIGWGFDETAIAQMGWQPYAHKQFLINFYSGAFTGSFSSGELYQFNPVTMDARTNGTLASLLGLEQAIKDRDVFAQEEAIKRINLAHALILAYRGIPLIYSGDEIATINDRSYLLDPDKMAEGRWIHRPYFDWKRLKNISKGETFEAQTYHTLKKLIAIRSKQTLLNGQVSQVALDVGNRSVFCILRQARDQSLIGLFNFSEYPQEISTLLIRQTVIGETYTDLVQGKTISLRNPQIHLHAFEYLWLIQKKES